MENKDLQVIYDELLSGFQNLRAEFVLAELFETSSISYEEIEIRNISTFSRSYRRDITDLQIDNFSSDITKLLFFIARNGLYDLLPQGLFHKQSRSTERLSFKEIRRKNKREDKEARKFFSPIENELFYQKVKIEEHERELLISFLTHKNDFLFDFWGVSRDIPEEFGQRLMKLLPFVTYIYGNIELTTLCLANVIDEKVQILKKYKTIKILNEKEEDQFNILGVDFILDSDSSTIACPVYEIHIGPVVKKDAYKFIQNGENQKIIHTFCDYFVPIEVEIEIHVNCAEEDRNFILDKEDNPRLGVTTTI